MMQHSQVSRPSGSSSHRTKPVSEGPFCSFSHRTCMQNKLQGYNFCIKHILEDTNAPFKQCNYISNKTGKRCTNAAVRTERKDGYCTEHARRTIILRQRATRKRKPEETAQQLLEELEQHLPRPSNHGHELRKSRSVESVAARVLEYASSTDSEAEGNAVDSAWLGDGDSDAESVDSEQEDPLKHAGVYTAEEVALIARDKMIRLQSLYIDQFKRLQHLLKEKRRKYLHSVRGDREQFGSISNTQEDAEQKDMYDKLQAMKRYHRRFGKEALMHRLNKERRMQVSEGSNYKPPSYPKCIQHVSGSKCGERTIPLSKYCMQHILNDPHQVLFQNCSFSESACERPVAALSGDDSVCTYHTQLEENDCRLPPVQDSQDSDSKEKIIKTEFKKSDDEAGTEVDVTSVSEIPLVVKTLDQKKTKQPKPPPSSTVNVKREIPQSVVDFTDEQTMSGTEDTDKPDPKH